MENWQFVQSLILDNTEESLTLEEFLEEWNNSSDTVLVHTSGSTGKPKPMHVEKRRMEASARMTCDFLGLHEGDTALLCLPLDFIAGKMMVVRALTRGLRLIEVEPSGHPLRESTQKGRFLLCNSSQSTQREPSLLCTFAAMVPLQVWNSLQVPEERERLMQIKQLIIGGGAIDEALERKLNDFPNAVWSTYGMTETLSHIALRRLNGPERSEWYTPFDGVSLSLSEDGCLVIDAPAVHDGPLVTNDIVEFEENEEWGSLRKDQGTARRFRILGRKDNVICSGGIKIQIEEVERTLHPYLAIPFLVTCAKDERLGEQVVLLIEQGEVDEVEAICHRTLPKYWQPRHILSIDHLPMTPTGKPARSEARKLVEQLIAEHKRNK
jgi:O-succinylbenzoic acid--CoA ligase